MTEDVDKVLKEFAGNRAAMAAEIARLRALLDDAGYEISRLAMAQAGASVYYPAASPPIRPLAAERTERSELPFGGRK